MLLLVIVVFFAGSAVCSFVDIMAAFIAGRAIQGGSAAGLQNLVIICISDLYSLRKMEGVFTLV